MCSYNDTLRLGLCMPTVVLNTMLCHNDIVPIIFRDILVCLGHLTHVNDFKLEQSGHFIKINYICINVTQNRKQKVNTENHILNL